MIKLHSSQFARLSLAARAFVLLALAVPALVGDDKPVALTFLGLVAATWVVAQIVEFSPRAPSTTVLVLVAAVTGGLCAYSFTEAEVVGILGVLCVTPFVAGLFVGLRGVGLSLLAQLLGLAGTGWWATDVTLTALRSSETAANAAAVGILTWSMTGLGLGLVATFLHSSVGESTDPLAPYHYAQNLIRQLIDLSGGLSSGLDPVSLGGAILSTVRDDIPTTSLVMHIPRGDTLAPLITKSMSSPADVERTEDIAVEAWAVRHPVIDGSVFAFPLHTEAGITAVVAGILSDRIDPHRLGIEERIRRLHSRLETNAVHLDTALLFSAFRDAATAEERRRLAREMHDGVAQDIASLGYLVDALAAGPMTPDQAERVELLRDRITAVVSEIRRSVVTLRTSVGASESLGTAIGSIARNLSEVSGVPIHVTLDERTGRLRPEVEAELFRIAQEAMNNAVKHAQAAAIDVHCVVHPPEAMITVVDDGRGLQSARSTSHGMEIMKERALLIDADLHIKDVPSGGLSVSVHVGGRSSQGSSSTRSVPHARATA